MRFGSRPAGTVHQDGRRAGEIFLVSVPAQPCFNALQRIRQGGDHGTLPGSIRMPFMCYPPSCTMLEAELFQLVVVDALRDFDAGEVLRWNASDRAERTSSAAKALPGRTRCCPERRCCSPGGRPCRNSNSGRAGACRRQSPAPVWKYRWRCRLPLCSWQQAARRSARTAIRARFLMCSSSAFIFCVHFLVKPPILGGMIGAMGLSNSIILAARRCWRTGGLFRIVRTGGRLSTSLRSIRSRANVYLSSMAAAEPMADGRRKAVRALVAQPPGTHLGRAGCQ